MARGQNPRQPDLFLEAWRRSSDYTFFSLPQGSRLLSEYSVDAITPWFQGMLQRLSPKERMATLAICRMNAEKPIGSAFTLDHFKEQILDDDLDGKYTVRGFHYVECLPEEAEFTIREFNEKNANLVAECGITEPGSYRRQRKIAPRRVFSDMLSALERLRVIRLATVEEAKTLETRDLRNKIYIFACPEFEAWFRFRTFGDGLRRPSPDPMQPRRTLAELVAG